MNTLFKKLWRGWKYLYGHLLIFVTFYSKLHFFPLAVYAENGLVV